MTLDDCRLADIHARVAKAASEGRSFAITESGVIPFTDVENAAGRFAAALAKLGLLPQGRIALTGGSGGRRDCGALAGRVAAWPDLPVRSRTRQPGNGRAMVR